MLKISRLADYSLLILNCLATEPLSSLSAAQLAVKTHLSQYTVSKLLKKMTEVGLLQSIRGANGGYCLARQPEEIRLADVIKAIEGEPALTDCSRAHYQCAQDRFCQLRGNWQVINQAIQQLLASLTLADMRQPLVLTQAQSPLWRALLKPTQDVNPI